MLYVSLKGIEKIEGVGEGEECQTRLVGEGFGAGE